MEKFKKSATILISILKIRRPFVVLFFEVDNNKVISSDSNSSIRSDILKKIWHSLKVKI